MAPFTTIQKVQAFQMNLPPPSSGLKTIISIFNSVSHWPTDNKSTMISWIAEVTERQHDTRQVEKSWTASLLAKCQRSKYGSNTLRTETQLYSKGFWLWCTTLEITGSSSGILKCIEHGVSETGSVSVLSWVGEDTYTVGPLERHNPGHWNNDWCWLFLRDPTW
jgi:hypothetical protein